MPHALLISGPAGIGKEQLCLAFAASLLCENLLAEGSACGACDACRWLALDSHPDLRILRPTALAAPDQDEKPEKKKSFEITIDQVRALDDFLHVGGHRQGRRVILVSPAEAMNRSTANALLKSLEEPGEGVQFLLVSSRPDELLPTVRSRCQQLNVSRPDPTQALSLLCQTDPYAAEERLALAGGAPFAAIQLSEPDTATLFKEWQATVRAGMEVDPLAASAAIDSALTKGAKGGEIRLVIDWMQRWIHDLALARFGQSPRFFPTQTRALGQLSKTTSQRKLFLFNRLLTKCKKLSEHPLNSRLFLQEILSGYRDLFSSESLQ
jgi:DNA polymerase-3 subunit delta'